MQLYKRRKMFCIYRDEKKSRTLVRKGQIQNTVYKMLFTLIHVTFVCMLRNSGLPWWLSDENLPCQCRRPGFDPWVRKIP